MATEIVEHIVLFVVKPETEAEKAKVMVEKLNGLALLPLPAYLGASPIFRTKSSPFAFTHILHSRFASLEDYNAFASNPTHLGVVSQYVLPIISDNMAVNWSASLSGPVKIPSGAAVRETYLKLKENVTEAEKKEIYDVIAGLKGKFSLIEQLSYGDNFAPADRGKGFIVSSAAVFKGLDELDLFDSLPGSAFEEDKKVKTKVDSVIVVDFIAH